MKLLLFAVVAMMATTVAPVSSARSSLAVSSDSKKICTKEGGKVQDYVLYNGKAPEGIPMARPMQVCSFPNKAAGTNNAFIVSLDTLASTKPTLAVLAFQARIPPMPATSGSSTNPSNLYCNQLGGTTAVDSPVIYLPIPSAKLDWWTKKPDGSWKRGDDFCTFPDGSAMSPWTLYMHANTNNSAPGIKFAYKKPDSNALPGNDM